MANASIIVELVDKATASLKNIESQVSNFEKGVNRSNSALTKMNSTVVKVGSAIAAAFAGRAVISTTAQFEDLRDSLNRVFGSVEAGTAAFENITDFAQSTQFGIQDLTQTLIKLKASGVDPTDAGLRDMNDLLTLFTDTAAITTDQLGSLQAMADLFSRTTAGGLGLEDLNRLADRGVPVFAILEEQLGLTRLEISKVGQTSEGARIILEALTRGLRESFGGATADRLDNLSTSMSNFGIAMDLTTDIFMMNLGPALTKLINRAGEFVESFQPILYLLGNALAKAVEFVTEHFTLFASAISALLGLQLGSWLAVIVKGLAKFTIIPTIITYIRGLAAALVTLSMSNPFTAIALAAATAATLIITNWDDVKSWFGKMFNYLELGWLNVKKWTYEALDAAPFADFSKEIENTTDKINELSLEMERTAEEVDNTTQTTEDFTNTVNENTRSINDNEDASQDLRQQLKGLEGQVKKVESAYIDYTKQLDRSVKLSGLDNEEREVQIELYKALEAKAESLGKTVEQLTETERKNVEDYVRGSLTKIRQNETEETRRRDFAQETDRIIQQSYQATTSKLEQLEKAKQDYIQQARQLGLENEKATQDAILGYNKEIAAEIVRVNEEKHKEIIDATKSALEDQMSAYDVYTKGVNDLNEALNDGIKISDAERVAYLKQLNEEYVDAMTGEYNDLYGLFEEKITDMTGLSQKEFGIMEEVVQLAFGVNITDIIKGTFASGIQAILGFRNGGTNELNTFAGATPGIFGGIGSTISSTFISDGLSAIGNFALSGLDLLGGLASDIFTLFGGVGSFLGDTFGGAFKTISSAIGSLFDFGASAVSGIGSTIGSFFGPVGSVVGSIVDFFFADGGYIAPGGVGIVGEAGPELVSGPAYVTSAKDTASMLSGGRGSNVNVNFTINAIDSRSVEQMLVEQRYTIQNVIRQAVEERPSANRSLR